MLAGSGVSADLHARRYSWPTSNPRTDRRTGSIAVAAAHPKKARPRNSASGLIESRLGKPQGGEDAGRTDCGTGFGVEFVLYTPRGRIPFDTAPTENRRYCYVGRTKPVSHQRRRDNHEA